VEARVFIGETAQVEIEKWHPRALRKARAFAREMPRSLGKPCVTLGPPTRKCFAHQGRRGAPHMPKATPRPMKRTPPERPASEGASTRPHVPHRKAAPLSPR
jgi:hypothetical protein